MLVVVVVTVSLDLLSARSYNAYIYSMTFRVCPFGVCCECGSLLPEHRLMSENIVYRTPNTVLGSFPIDLSLLMVSPGTDRTLININTVPFYMILSLLIGVVEVDYRLFGFSV